MIRSLIIDSPRGSIAEALWHGAILSLLFLASIVAIDFVVGSLASFVVIIVYVMWNAVTQWSVTTGAAAAPNWVLRVLMAGLFVILQICLGLIWMLPIEALATFALSFSADKYAIARFATEIITGADAAEHGVYLLSRGAILLLLAAALAFLGIIISPGVGFERWWSIRNRIGNRWLGAWLKQMIICLPVGVAFLGMAGVSMVGNNLATIGSNLNYSWAQTGHGVLLEFPSLLIFVFGAALMLATHRSLLMWYTRTVTAVQSQDTGETGEPATGNLRLFVVLLPIWIVASAYMMVEILRIGLTAAHSSVVSIALWTTADKELREWLEASVAAGEGAEALVARLNESGRWHSDEAEQGLAEILPVLAEDFGDPEAHKNCSIALAAGLLSEQERLSVARHYSNRSDSFEPPEGMAMPIRFCFTVDCRDPKYFATDAQSFPWHLSSHSSANEGWGGYIAINMFYDELPNPGGYCTTTGGLAEIYQG